MPPSRAARQHCTSTARLLCIHITAAELRKRFEVHYVRATVRRTVHSWSGRLSTCAMRTAFVSFCSPLCPRAPCTQVLSENFTCRYVSRVRRKCVSFCIFDHFILYVALQTREYQSLFVVVVAPRALSLFVLLCVFRSFPLSVSSNCVMNMYTCIIPRRCNSARFAR